MAILAHSPMQRLSAQEGKQNSGRAAVGRQSNRQAAQRTPAQLRSELDALYTELEATVKFVSAYAIGRDSFQQMGFDGGMPDVILALATSQKQLQNMPDGQLMQAGEALPNSADLNKAIVSLQKMRTDPEFQAALTRADQWYTSEGGRSLREDRNANAKSAPSAPAFIRPVCHFDDLLNYPSAKDLSIAKAFAFAAEIVFLLVPAEVEIPIIGVEAPNPVRIALAIAWGVLEAISLGLDQARSEGLYCQSLAFTIAGNLTNDGRFQMSLVLPRSAGGYADFVKDYVTAAISIAGNRNLLPPSPQPPCATNLLNEANTYYANNQWIEAYKKYREAYSKIGAATCVPPSVP